MVTVLSIEDEIEMLNKSVIILYIIRFCMHDQFCGCGQHYPNGSKFSLEQRGQIIEVGQ